jgi:type IV pilus assembly protein PilQ
MKVIFQSVALLLALAVAPADGGEQAQSRNRFVDIDFRLNQDKASVITVELASKSAIVDVREKEGGLDIELLNTRIDDASLFVVDVRDFSAPVKEMETFREEQNTRIGVEVATAFTYDYRLQENLLEVVISERPELTPVEVEQKSILEREGKLISINFQDIPVRNVLQLIADYNDFNLVVSDSVEGNVTLRLDGVAWQQVLDIITQVKGLGIRVEGNVVLVAPKQELAEREQKAVEQARLAEELSELHSEVINISFAKASEIAAMIDGEGDNNMLSSRGSITVDERTNTILIRELPHHIEEIKALIASLDIPVKQVQIEARLVSISEGDIEELGVRWGTIGTGSDVLSTGSIESNRDILSGAAKGEDVELNINEYLNVNLGAGNSNAASMAFSVAKISGVLLDLELSALQAESKAEIISSPRLLTTNKKPAYIEQGTELPYLEATSSGATSVSFKKAVLSLKVTPQITADNRLVLDLSVSQDKPGLVVKAGLGEAVAINTQRIGTQVLVNNGETVVLGGIYQHDVHNMIDKVPLLGDLPLLGHLFKRSYENVRKSELLIFVTPKVILK